MCAKGGILNENKGRMRIHGADRPRHSLLHRRSPPFEAATGDYTYYIFAYDERNQTVRYIYAYSEVGGQPYYLTLEW